MFVTKVLHVVLLTILVTGASSSPIPMSRHVMITNQKDLEECIIKQFMHSNPRFYNPAHQDVETISHGCMTCWQQMQMYPSSYHPCPRLIYVTRLSNHNSDSVLFTSNPSCGDNFGKSTFRRKLYINGVSAWVKVRRGNEKLPGLVGRRKFERKLIVT